MPKRVSNKWVFTDEEVDAKIAHGKSLYEDYVKDKPIATSYKFDPLKRIVSVRAKDGSRIDFPVSKIRELQNAADKEIEKGYITDGGDALHWDNLDAHYTIAGLAANVFGTKEWMRHLGSIGGSKTSVEKTAAARLNGLKGGRPRTKTHQVVGTFSTQNEAVEAARVLATRSKFEKPKPGAAKAGSNKKPASRSHSQSRTDPSGRTKPGS